MVVFCLVFLQACKGNAVSTQKGAVAGPLKLVEVQGPVVAGGFYPSSKSELENQLNAFLNNAKAEKVSGDIMGIIVPHAGYQYSGQVAAYGYKQVEGKKYDYVVVLGLSHHVRLTAAATRYAKYYETPLEKIPVATDVVEKMLKKYDWIIDSEAAFSKEHSLEVQLPFLQKTLKDFKLVPLLIGTTNMGMIEKIAAGLNEEFIGKNVLYVVSTDLSHYHPYAEAVKLDKHLLNLLVNEKYEEFTREYFSGKCELCGFGPVEVMLYLYKMIGGGEVKLLKYANSGDVTGDKARVVGYAALAVIKKFQLSDSEKSELLKIAKNTLETFVRGGRPALPRISDSYLMKPGAPFVTLRKNGQLRGCIGHIIAKQPLAKAVVENTVAAASEDPRFRPVTPDELKDISIEISVLTPPQPVFDPNTIVVGRDGLIISKGFNRGVLLPQVPEEQGWDLPRYLDGILEKAGLKADALSDPETRLFRFQALVFSERE